MIGVDLGHMTLAGAARGDLLDTIVFAATPATVRDVIVGGEHIVARGHHPDAEEIVGEYRAAARRVLSE
jgi:hypothetical protein